MGNAQVMTAKVAWDNGCLLGDHRAALLPAPLPPTRSSSPVDRSADAALLRPARAHAAVPARVGRGRRRRSTATASPTSSPSSTCGELQASLGGAADGRRRAAREARRRTSRCSSGSPRTLAGASPRRAAPVAGRFVSCTGDATAADRRSRRCCFAAGRGDAVRRRSPIGSRQCVDVRRAVITSAESLPPKPSDVETRAAHPLLARVVGDDVDGALRRRSRA